MKKTTGLIVALAIIVGGPAAAFAQSSTSTTTRERTRAQQERIRDQQRQQQEERQRQQQTQRERMLEQRRAAQERAYPARQEERTSRTLKIGGRGELTISNLVGDTVITRRGGDEVQIEAIKVARGRTDADAREMLPLVNVDFTERGGRGEVRATYPHHDRQVTGPRRNVNVSVNFNVSAPENTRITVKTLSGDVTVSDIKGELSLVTTSGNVSITNAGRIAEARSTSGDVEVTSVTTENALELTSISGNVVARRVKAPRMELETVSGRVIIEEVEVPRIDAQSITGAIEFSGRLAKSGRYDFNSHSGNVQLTLAGDTGFEFDANSFSGTVKSDFTLKDETSSEGRGRGGRRSLQGIFGDGSAIVDVTTFSGSVIVTRK